MFAVSPVRLLVKIPVPVPSTVLLFAVVGLGLVLQHTPRAVMPPPPESVTSPPPVALVNVISVMGVVVTVASTGEVVNDCSLP